MLWRPWCSISERPPSPPWCFVYTASLVAAGSAANCARLGAALRIEQVENDQVLWLNDACVGGYVPLDLARAVKLMDTY
jgi:hypothetical protein